MKLVRVAGGGLDHICIIRIITPDIIKYPRCPDAVRGGRRSQKMDDYRGLLVLRSILILQCYFRGHRKPYNEFWREPGHLYRKGGLVWC